MGDSKVDVRRAATVRERFRTPGTVPSRSRLASCRLAGINAGVDVGAEVPVHPSEGATAAAPDRAAPVRTSLAALLTRHILHDGEVVLLILKPSLWFIIFNSMRFSAIVLILLIAAQLWMPDRTARTSAELAIFLIAGRVTWSLLVWISRLYVLTDLRIVRLSGVFNVEIFDCALRKVARTKLTRTFRERLWRLGSIEIYPGGEGGPPGLWQTIRRPAEVHQKICITIDRAKQGDGVGQ